MKQELIQLAQTWFLAQPEDWARELKYPPRGPVPGEWLAREEPKPCCVAAATQDQVSVAERLMWLYLMQAYMTELHP